MSPSNSSLIRKKTVLVSIALLAILLVSGALPTAGGFSRSSLSSVQTTSVTLKASAPSSVGTAGRFLSGPFHVTPTFSTAPSDPRISSSPLTPPDLNPKPAIGKATRDAPNALTVSCPSASCQSVNSGSGGAITNPLGLNVVDTTTSFGYTIEPPDQGLCANGQFAVELLNIGVLQIFSSSTLKPVANGFTTLDNLMGLPSHGTNGWSSAGDVSCLFDYANGGHWFITEFVSASPEAPQVPGGQPGPFQGCFVGVPNTCLEGIAVSATSNPKGPYNVYFLNPNRVNKDPGASGGVLLNDFTKIGATNDAFLLFYDEFNLGPLPLCPAFGCLGFNGAQQFAFSKNGLELGLSSKSVTVAYENMGNAKNLYPIPANGGFQPVPLSCFNGPFAGLVCWSQVIPAQTPDPTQFDNSHGGSGFMIGSLDFLGAGDNRVAVFDWTGLSNLNSASCSKCGGIAFGGQVITSGLVYLDEGQACLVQFGGFCGLGNQKAGPIPLGNNCFLVPTITHSCPESGISTGGDGATQVSFAHGAIWAAVSTALAQIFGASSEIHVGAAFWQIGTSSFDSKGSFSVTSQGYVSAAHEDIEYPAIAGTDSGNAVMSFTLSGRDFFPSSAYGTLTSSSTGLVGVIHIADLGRSPQDGFTEYQGFPGLTRPRWGDYGQAIFVPGMGVFFSTEYIQHPNCGNAAFLSSGGTCGGTREPFANWGSSVNFIKAS